MQARPQAGKIQPRLSSIPRPRTEAANYLEMHKLATEKSRLDQELQRIANRTAIIHDRLRLIEQELKQRRATATPVAVPAKTTAPPPQTSLFNLELVDLKY